MKNLPLKNWLELFCIQYGNQATVASPQLYIWKFSKRILMKYKKLILKSTMGMTAIALYTTNALASNTSNLPFNSTMNILKEAISGPFLLSAAIILIVITCLMLAFGEWGEGFKRLINIVLWLSIAFAATGFVTSMFGGSAGL